MTSSRDLRAVARMLDARVRLCSPLTLAEMEAVRDAIIEAQQPVRIIDIRDARAARLAAADLAAADRALDGMNRIIDAAFGQGEDRP